MTMTDKSTARRDAAYRRDTLWIAALIHRLSGVGLAVFLPFHFLVLGFALKGELALDGFLAWTRQPLVKLAEAGLVFLLAIHLLGGVRVMLIEARGWSPGQRNFVMASIFVAALTGAAFLIIA
jgi:fumarate reductase subunit D